METTLMNRQGDILIVPVNEIPTDAVKVDRDAGRAILAYGEVTGHAHAFKDADVVTFRDPKLNELFFQVTGSHAGKFEGELIERNDARGYFLANAKIDGPARRVKFLTSHATIEDGVIETNAPFSLLEHDEHDAHAYKSGTYKVDRQREYHPQAIRNVAD